MSSHYMLSGNRVTLIGKGDSVVNKLPGSTFVVKVDPYGNFFLEKIDDMALPPKIYGNAIERADRIINTFSDRSSSTGIMLSGEKGSGKTLLTKALSQTLRKRGIPTIIINTAYSGDVFNSFIAGIAEEAMIVFDEFEKVYPAKDQEALLTLLDGTFNSKKLFVITVNESHRTNDFMNNRPGRIYYSYKYTGLDESFIRDYCADSLEEKHKVEEIVVFSKMFADFNFDMLKAIVEELNRYGETVTEVVSHLNVSPSSGNYAKYTATIVNYTNPVLAKYDWKIKTVNNDRYFNPFSEDFHLYMERDNVPNDNTDDTDTDTDSEDVENYGTTSYVYFKASDLVSLGNGNFMFKNSDMTIALKKKPTISVADMVANGLTNPLAF